MEEYDRLYLAYNRLRNLVAAGRNPQAAAKQAATEWSMGDPDMLVVLTDELSKVAAAIEIEETDEKVWDAVGETHD